MMAGPVVTVRRCIYLLGMAVALALPAEADARSKLSRWVFDETVPALQTLFSGHPRVIRLLRE